VQAVTARVAEEMGVPIEALFNGRRTRTIVAHRALVCFVAVHAGGLALRTVAEILGVSAPTVMRGVRIGPEILRRTGLRADALLP
jgi:chromosomal replication initiation ATPase DnaA